MEVLVVLDVLLVCQHKVPHVSRLHLAEGGRSLVVEAAAVLGGAALLSPVEVPVPVGVSALTLVTLVPRCRLPPHSVFLSCLMVSVRIVRGQKVPIEFSEEIRVVYNVL